MLNRNNLAIAKAAPKDEGKYVLQGILIEPRQSIVTDGHMMIIVAHTAHSAADFPNLGGGHVSQDEFPAFMIPTKTALEIAKAIPTKTTLPILEHAAVSHFDGDHVSMVATDLETERVFRFKRLVGQFPNWRAVLPHPTEDKPSITFDVDILQDTLNHLKSMGVSAITMRFNDGDSPMRIDGVIKETGQAVTAIVVPMNSKVAGVPMAEWGPAPATTMTTVQKKEQVPA